MSIDVAWVRKLREAKRANDIFSDKAIVEHSQIEQAEQEGSVEGHS